MTPERYQALLRWLEARPALKKLVIALNRWLPAVPFACYPLLLVLLNVRWFRLLSANRAAALDFMQLIARAVFVPAFVFLGGTLLRARLNFPRPYEQPGFTPLVPKETHGKSFPSRHALSAAVLAAVSGIQHYGLPACSGHGGPGRRSGPQGSRSCRRQERHRCRHHISPPKQHDHLRTPSATPYEPEDSFIPYHIFRQMGIPPRFPQRRGVIYWVEPSIGGCAHES